MPHNSTDLPWAVSDLVLGPTENMPRTYKFYNLDSDHQIVANQFTLLLMPCEVADCVHAIANVQQMPADLIFTNAEGHIIDDDGANIAPLPDQDDNHMSVNPADSIYIGLHNLPVPHFDDDHNASLPNFQVHPADDGGADVLPNEQ